MRDSALQRALLEQWRVYQQASSELIEGGAESWPGNPLRDRAQAEGMAFAYLFNLSRPELAQLYYAATGDTEHKVLDPGEYGSKHFLMSLVAGHLENG